MAYRHKKPAHGYFLFFAGLIIPGPDRPYIFFAQHFIGSVETDRLPGIIRPGIRAGDRLLTFDLKVDDFNHGHGVRDRIQMQGLVDLLTNFKQIDGAAQGDEALAARLQREGVQAFGKSWSGLLARIRGKGSLQTADAAMDRDT